MFAGPGNGENNDAPGISSSEKAFLQTLGRYRAGGETWHGGDDETAATSITDWLFMDSVSEPEKEEGDLEEKKEVVKKPKLDLTFEQTRHKKEILELRKELESMQITLKRAEDSVDEARANLKELQETGKEATS